MSQTPPPLALIMGFSVHGLALARALHKAGVEVHAFTPPGSRFAATSFTRYARVQVRERLNAEDLLEHLLSFARALPEGQKTVLFPTNDRMAGTVARHWDQLNERFLLSWAHCRELVLTLQLKDSLPAFADRARILHPRSLRIESVADCSRVAGELPLPCIVKPVAPLSGFKALLAGSRDELVQLVTTHAADLPFIAQELIDGEEENLFACTAFLDHGRELGLLTSRKRAASPPGLGQGTVFHTAENPAVVALTRQFFQGLNLSGPVALEFKQDRQGRYWMIEPNVGRTEYCVDLAIQAGINLPWIEYCLATGRPVGAQHTTLRQHRCWFDTDKDPFCYWHNRSRLKAQGAPIFPFVGTGDWGPLGIACLRQSFKLASRALSGLRQLIRERETQP